MDVADMNKIVISSGHGKYIRGASDIIDEVDEARRVVDRVAELLKAAGVGVVVFHDNTSTTQSENLNTIVAFHNEQTRELDVSVHFNAYEHTSKPMGTEVLYVTQDDLAADVSEAITDAAGFIDRGAKERTDLAFLNNTDEPAILIETCFVDSSADVSLYQTHFDSICAAIAESISDVEVSVPPEQPPSEPPARPPWPDRPESIPVEGRPTLRCGDDGQHVLDMQRMIPRFSGEFDGDFGPTTEDNVRRYQKSRGLDADGVCGQQTWQALYDHKLPVPPPPPPPGALTAEQQAAIMNIANESDIADYEWEDDRGVAPTGFTQGMALSFAQTYLKLLQNHPAAVEMAKARTDSDKDVFNVYRDQFNKLGMPNETAGIDTLRHLYAFMLGSGMRESSGQHCCGRDQSAENYDSNTCEAGAFQTSYNAAGASNPEFDNLMDEYLAGKSPGYLDAWSEGVSCSSADWDCYGSGRGFEFQELCKNAPAFSAESHGLTLRNLCNHYGPVIRGEVEVRREADEMLKEVQDYLDAVA
jgi:N-acetylmuramoyl-L-alanine amidase